VTTVRSLQLALIVSTLFPGSVRVSAQYAWFARNTDVIAVDGRTDLRDQCTIEAIVLLPSASHSGGSIFDEWLLSQEEKYLGVSVDSISAATFPNDYMNVTEKHGLLSLDKWHHVAFVCNGSEQRIYLDGQRIQSGPALDPIGNGSASAFIGYAPRDGSDFPSFVGFLDSIRVSKVARYSGLSFTPPTGDLRSDDDTLLLYNFNDSTNSTTVRDEGPLHRTGTLGTGFPGATAPLIVSKLRDETPLDLKVFTAVEVQFSTQTNVLYQIQSSPDMEVWTDLAPVSGNGSISDNLFSTQNSGKLFYRVVVSP
jgi:hypothetical protein